MTFAVRRSGVWLPPAFITGLHLLFVVGAPEFGYKAFFGVMSVATCYWLVRAWRVRVDVTRRALVVHGQFRTWRFAVDELHEASVARMRTASPFQKWLPYVALQVELRDGRVRQFDEVSAAASRRAPIDSIVAAIRTHV